VLLGCGNQLRQCLLSRDGLAALEAEAGVIRDGSKDESTISASPDKPHVESGDLNLEDLRRRPPLALR
jgi:hypothetical protein